MEARQHLLAQVVVVTQRTPAPAYNAVAVSRDRAGLQCRGRFSRPHWLAIPWPSLAITLAYNKEDDSPVRTGLQTLRLIHLSAPVADSPVSDFNLT